MAIYDKPVKTLMREFAEQILKPDQVFSKDDAVRWFSAKYPRIKSNTVRMHVEGLSTNAATQRKHSHQIRRGAGWDLFFKLGQGQYRLYDPLRDPEPFYPNENPPPIIDEESLSVALDEEAEIEDNTGRTFALESHLRDFLALNLSAIESGMTLFEQGGLKGIEYPAGGRFIDLLGVSKSGDIVVIELKVSRGYERTIGQILRYMAWIQKNLAGDRKVRGVIVANEISDDLRLAASRLMDVDLIEYELQFKLKPAIESQH